MSPIQPSLDWPFGLCSRSRLLPIPLPPPPNLSSSAAVPAVVPDSWPSAAAVVVPARRPACLPSGAAAAAARSSPTVTGAVAVAVCRPRRTKRWWPGAAQKCRRKCRMGVGGRRTSLIVAERGPIAGRDHSTLKIRALITDHNGPFLNPDQFTLAHLWITSIYITS